MAFCPKNVLLIEDHDVQAALIERVLKQCNETVRVQRLRDGTEAMSFVARGPYPLEDETTPDLILLDLILPGVHGLEVLKAIKAHPTLRLIPTVVLTADEDDAKRLTAYQLHVNSFLIKGTDFRQFVQMIRDLDKYWNEWNQPV